MTTIQTATHGSEGGHWYTQDHQMVELVQGSKGLMIEPTLVHARKLQLAPGVTTILRVADKPALNTYFIKQAVLAALTLPRLNGESDDDFVARVIRDSKEAGRKAAEGGTKIHAEVQHAPDATIPSAHAMAVRQYLLQAFGDQEWISEACCTSPFGYGTKADLHTKTGILIDIKTKDTVDPFTMVTFGDHWEQLAATEQALRHRFSYEPFHVRGILFVSRTVPTDIVLKEISNQEFDEGWQRFQLLLQYWQVSKRYRPEWAERVR